MWIHVNPCESHPLVIMFNTPVVNGLSDVVSSQQQNMGSVMFCGVFNINWYKHLVSNPRHNKVRQILGQMGNPRTIPFPLQLDGPRRIQGTWFVLSHMSHFRLVMFKTPLLVFLFFVQFSVMFHIPTCFRSIFWYFFSCPKNDGGCYSIVALVCHLSCQVGL